MLQKYRPDKRWSVTFVTEREKTTNYGLVGMRIHCCKYCQNFQNLAYVDNALGEENIKNGDKNLLPPLTSAKAFKHSFKPTLI